MFIGQPVTGLTLGFGGRSWRFPVVIPIDFALQIAGEFMGTFAETNNFCQAANAGIQFNVQFLDASGKPLDVSGATVLTIAFQQPDGTQVPHTAQYVTNGIDGRIFYVTNASDFLEAGLAYVQGQVTVGGSILTTAWGQFEVNANL